MAFAVSDRCIPVRRQTVAVTQERAVLLSIALLKPFFGHASRGQHPHYRPVSPKQLDTSVQDSGIAELMSHDSLSPIRVMHSLAALGL